MPTASITPYLFFNGRCDEALAFYRSALGAEVGTVMRYRESPDPPPPGMLPPGYEDKVMHSVLHVGGAVLMASDGPDTAGTIAGCRISLALPTEAAARAAYAALADGGQVDMPIGPTFWSPCFGMVIDRFGVGWMVSLATEMPNG